MPSFIGGHGCEVFFSPLHSSRFAAAHSDQGETAGDPRNHRVGPRKRTRASERGQESWLVGGAGRWVLDAGWIEESCFIVVLFDEDDG